jgi:hypothetical protein
VSRHGTALATFRAAVEKADDADKAIIAGPGRNDWSIGARRRS